MTQAKQPEFGKWRSFFWPVHGFELKKLLPMFFLFFFISFNYTILRDTKDTLVVTSSGAETIPFLKFWGVVPAAVIFMLVYSKLSNILSKEKLFYATIFPFIIFFGLFPLAIYPNREWLHPTTSADWLQSVLPMGLSGLISCYRDWTLSLFYILSELWGSVVLSLLFWGFANDITKVTEAKRFYSLFGLGANLALLFSGPAIVWVSQQQESLPPESAWQISLNYLMGMVFVAGMAVVAIYWWINRNVLTDPRFYDPTEEKKAKKSKPKMSLTDSFKYLLSSKYILCIATLVIAYGISINLVEVTWKNQLKQQFANANQYSAFMGWFSFTTGLVTILMMLFVGGNLMRRKGWGFTAMVTPVVLLVTGIGFFAFVLFRDYLYTFLVTFGTSPLMLAVLFGAAQNIMSKSAKYSLFDPTKEMAYIPLDPEAKVKGKAAIDVVGARLGKSGGSFIQQGLLVMFGTIGAITPYVAAILFVIIAAWIVAVRSLNKQFVEITGEKIEKPATVS
ncbi:MAG: NTP/NDP exchange transporter [Chlamydiia bacterium]|nr:NTP/NDP exchange transporter [Chlamydiia bacterium]